MGPQPAAPGQDPPTYSGSSEGAEALPQTECLREAGAAAGKHQELPFRSLH